MLATSKTQESAQSDIRRRRKANNMHKWRHSVLLLQFGHALVLEVIQVNGAIGRPYQEYLCSDPQNQHRRRADFYFRPFRISAMRRTQNANYLLFQNPFEFLDRFTYFPLGCASISFRREQPADLKDLSESGRQSDFR
jgi:hypothetical protein